jgi:hypothetical protein
LAAAGLGKPARQTQRNKGGQGAGAHGGQVAQSARQGAVADGFGLVPVEAEVLAVDGEVGGDGDLFAGAGSQERAVVADAEAKASLRPEGRTAADAPQQSQFAQVSSRFRLGFPDSHLKRIRQTAGRVRIGASSAMKPLLTKNENMQEFLCILR